MGRRAGDQDAAGRDRVSRRSASTGKIVRAVADAAARPGGGEKLAALSPGIAIRDSSSRIAARAFGGRASALGRKPATERVVSGRRCVYLADRVATRLHAEIPSGTNGDGARSLSRTCGR